jgi:hypothetical protein
VSRASSGDRHSEGNEAGDQPERAHDERHRRGRRGAGSRFGVTDDVGRRRILDRELPRRDVLDVGEGVGAGGEGLIDRLPLDLAADAEAVLSRRGREEDGAIAARLVEDRRDLEVAGLVPVGDLRLQALLVPFTGSFRKPTSNV